MNKEKELLIRKDTAIKAAVEAGRFLKDNFGKVTQIKAKENETFVTDIDLKTDEIITAHIKKSLKEDNIISEEKPMPELKAEYSWIIDPLDGTHNYIHNIDIFGVSIGVACGKEGVIGVIYMPVADELYVGVKGQGATLNNHKITVSDRDISRATMIFDSSVKYKKDPMLADLKDLSGRVFNIRMFGSTARSLSYIAEGKAEVEIEYNDQVWDFAAGLVLVEEAGGRSTDLEGNPWNIDTAGYIASNNLIHNEIVKIIGSN